MKVPNPFIKQMVYFDQGPYSGKSATVSILRPFRSGMILNVNGSRYKVTNGPISQFVEETQDAIEYGALRAVYVEEAATLSERSDEHDRT